MSIKTSAEDIPRALTLPNLLMLITFTISVEVAFLSMKNAGGGALRYSVGGIVAFCFGATMVWIEWNALRYILDRYAKPSGGWLLGSGILLSMVLWIAVGVWAGGKLGWLLAKITA